MDLRHGTTVWQRSLADGSARVAAADNDHIVLDRPDGTVEVLDAGTGRPLVTGALPPSQSPLDLDGDALYAVPAGDDRRIFDYDLATLAPRWSARLPDPPDSLWICGTAVCASAGNTLAALDRGTGRVRWREAGLPGARVDLGGRLSAPGSALADAFTSTGRTSAVYRMRPGPMVERGPPLYTMDAGTATLLVRLDPANGRRRVLGLLPARLASAQCKAAGGYLVCDVDGRYLAWRYPVG
ncbi:MAG: PQQ-binding-like beta-propeller repeat protein [Micromonosporaceae bacterium]|nr:PQQ-binding-like beta-propeller repeat protein [Micromonosporaceae bacterium]